MPGEPRPHWLAGILPSARSGAGFLHAQLLQDEPERALPGEAELKQIGVDEDREPQPAGAVKHCARRGAQRE